MTNTTTETKPAVKPLPPHPEKEHWFFRNAYYMIFNPLPFFREQSPKFKGIFRITSRFLNIIAVTDPEYVKHILQESNRNYKKWFKNDLLELVLGNGLLTSEGDFWRKQRRLAQPAFHKERLARMFDIMVAHTQHQIEKLEQLPQGQTIDISREMSELTLTIVAGAMFSTEVKGAIEVVSTEIERASQMATARFNNPFRLPIKYPTPANLRERRSVQRLDDVLNPIIANRRQSVQRFDDLLAMLMETKDEDTGEQMNNRQLRDETMTIFLAGHETTALALSWLWYLLDKNPAQAQKLYEEIDRVTTGQAPTAEMLHQMPYTRMVMDEALRMYPPAWLIMRESLDDDEVGGYAIPKGYTIMIPVYQIHHDPALWPEPDVFNPERFSKENAKAHHRFAYFPFGGGPRQCIGNNFALMEMQVIIVMMLQKFRFKTMPGFIPEMHPMVTLRMKNGMQMQVQKRSGLN
ncbi:MAG TPA: cytochrome P450 [Chitinophagales bacterium]|nr:cytochrome P450 [Chitinophagales bacterium]